MKIGGAHPGIQFAERAYCAPFPVLHNSAPGLIDVARIRPTEQEEKTTPASCLYCISAFCPDGKLANKFIGVGLGARALVIPENWPCESLALFFKFADCVD